MATVYKTPGVYVEEIPKLPPSIAQVETAIPAFIGYTQKAIDLSPDDLLKKPKRIGSVVEYELYYGSGPSPSISEIKIDSNNNFISATVTANFFLYDSLRMFYANGGGDCYIVSVGNYEATIDDDAIINGIGVLEKEDDPTIILTPDAAGLGDAELSNVQVAALSQCNFLQDRVAILDVKENDPKGVNFRNNIGINFLSYGAAYTPWLKVALPKTIRYSDIVKSPTIIKRAGVGVELNGLTADAEVQAQITSVASAYADYANIVTRTKAISPANGNLWDRFNSLEATFNGGNTDGALQNIFQYVYDLAALVNRYINGGAGEVLSLPELLSDVKDAVTSNFDPLIAEVKSLELEADANALLATYAVATLTVPAAQWPLSNAAAASAGTITGATEEEVRVSTLNNLKPLFDELNRAYLTIIANSAGSYTKTLDDSLALAFPVYKAIISGVSNSMTTMPPSGAVAGAYAFVDRSRGVWKAPANVSLTRVLAPAVTFTRSELDALNVDTTSGKSINAIRPFFGKGTLIFGARTLAGNDNEWRYISVRRFFNMVEESSKKASESFVFEPNDANTWVKVQGMIENFLITLWRQGALQGAKPDHAFYVAVGLGKTMTSLDILEGRMIVEIGMAVVRPAEFIILRFSHKMAES
jgi:phage tail sheath protein FI